MTTLKIDNKIIRVMGKCELIRFAKNINWRAIIEESINNDNDMYLDITNGCICSKKEPFSIILYPLTEDIRLLPIPEMSNSEFIEVLEYFDDNNLDKGNPQEVAQILISNEVCSDAFYQKHANIKAEKEMNIIDTNILEEQLIEEINFVYDKYEIQENKYIGLSLSLCIQDMLEKDIKLSEILYIISGTKCKNLKEFTSIVNTYGELYWQKDLDRGKLIAMSLWDKGKIVQPAINENMYNVESLCNGIWYILNEKE